MITTPKLKESYYVEIVQPHHVFLLTETSHFILSGPVYKHLIPLLDGNHTTTDILVALSKYVPIPQIYHTLNQLETHGHIVESTQIYPAHVNAFIHSVNTNTPLTGLQAARVQIHTVGAVETSEFETALAQIGIPVVTESPTLHVVITDDYLRSELASFNREMLASGQPWMLVKSSGTILWIGPCFEPGKTACWECMAQRIRNNRQIESYILRKTNRPEPLLKLQPALPATTRLVATTLATEILKWHVAGNRHPDPTQTQLKTVDTVNLVTESHTVVKRPQCPACGIPLTNTQLQPVTLNDCPKKFFNDGGHRAFFPEETYERYKHHISHITGVVTWLIDITDDVNGLAYSYIAGHNFAMVQDTLFWLRQNLRSRTGGKGMTQMQAKVSAIGEAIERYSGVYRGDEHTVKHSYTSLPYETINPQTIFQFSEYQYQNRYEWNNQQRGGSFHVVPNPFPSTQSIDWSPVWSLSENRFKYIPTAFCYYGHPETTTMFFCTSDSNGVSAGNTPEEAILQGFLELIERDSVALWWYNCIQRSALDLPSFKLPYLDALKAYYAEHKREFWVLDITSDLGIPTFAAVSRRTDHPVEDIILGFGAHLDPKIALLRAITELNQFLPAISKRDAANNTLYNWPDEEAVHWWKNAVIDQQTYLIPRPDSTPKRLDEFPSLHSANLKDDVLICVEIAQKAGLETLVLDQTRPDIGMSVFRVIVPGLRHFWRRLGPGRLYDVPVKMGWLTQQKDEKDLNPYSLFF